MVNLIKKEEEVGRKGGQNLKPSDVTNPLLHVCQKRHKLGFFHYLLLLFLLWLEHGLKGSGPILNSSSALTVPFK